MGSFPSNSFTLEWKRSEIGKEGRREDVGVKIRGFLSLGSGDQLYIFIHQFDLQISLWLNWKVPEVL